MEDKAYILSVDDESLNQDIIKDLLEDDFEIATVASGAECLESVKKHVPDLILMDVNMPVLNGLETVKRLRESEQCKDVPVIFVSALASVKERIAGYEAGGDDYITKPFDEEELRKKIAVMLERYKELIKANEEKEVATTTAMASMVSSYETGVVLQFMRSVMTIETLEELQELVLDSLAAYSLNACVMFTHLQAPVFCFSGGSERPIEKDVLIGAHNKGKIIEFSGRCIFNTPHAAILIRRMPDDAEKTGRYKDHLAILIDSLEEKLLQFIANEKKKEHYKKLDKVVESVTGRLQQVILSYQKQRLKNASLLGDLMQNIEASFLKLGLEESQEQLLLEYLSQAEQETDKIYADGQATSDTFDAIITDLVKLLE